MLFAKFSVLQAHRHADTKDIDTVIVSLLVSKQFLTTILMLYMNGSNSNSLYFWMTLPISQGIVTGELRALFVDSVFYRFIYFMCVNALPHVYAQGFGPPEAAVTVNCEPGTQVLCESSKCF